MESPHEEAFERLASAIEVWDAQFTRTHDQLAGQIAAARKQLEGMALAPGGVEAEPPEADHAACEARLAEAQASLQSAREEAADHRARVATLEIQVQVEGERADELDGQCGALRVRLEEAETRLSTQESERAPLEEEVEALREQAAAAETLRSQVAGLEQSMEEIQARAATLEAERDELEGARKRDAESSETKQRELAKRDAHIAELEFQLEEAQAEAVNADDAPAEMGETQAALDAAFAQRDARIAELETQLEMSRIEAGSAQAASAEMSEAQAALAEVLPQRDARIAELETQLEAAQIEAASAVGASLEMRNAQAAFDEALALERERAASLEGSGREERERAQSLRAELDKVNGRFARAERELEELRSQAPPDDYDAVVLAKREAEERIAELEGEVDALREEVAAAKDADASPGPGLSPGTLTKLAAATGGAGRKRRMGEILVDADVLDAPQLEQALRQQREDPQRRLGDLVVSMGLTSEEVVARVIASQLGLPFVALKDSDIDPSAPRLISTHLANLHTCVPLRREGDTLVLAMANPLDLIAIEDIELAARCRVSPVVATPAAIDFTIQRFGAKR